MRNLLFFIVSLFSTSVFSVDVKTYIPEKAKIYLPVLKVEQQKYFPDLVISHYFPGLIEHESCITLTSKRCWDPRSELRSIREQGLGLGQLTRTFRSDGSVRFDSLTDMRNRHKSDLKELHWDTVAVRPDLQLRTIILMSRDNHKQLYNIKDNVRRLHFMDAAYNTGLGNVQKKRRECGLRKGCDPQIWFDHTDNACAGMTKVLYGNRSACDIVKHHVKDVFTVRMEKYKSFYSRQ